MNTEQLIRLLESLPEPLRKRELVFYSVQDGTKFSVRTDVSQFAARGEALQIFIEERR